MKTGNKADVAPAIQAGSYERQLIGHALYAFQSLQAMPSLRVELGSYLAREDHAADYAPALLAALEACANRLGEMDCGPEWEQARAAITKAKGQP